jgi:DNA-binding NarL/FixJ family response regulator
VDKVRILLADDHLRLLDVVASILEPAFEIVGREGNGRALVEAAAKLRPDVIVTDISMPILNGIEAANTLRDSGSTSRIIFLTVHRDPDFIKACFAAGALGYVSKHRVTTDLLSAIQETLVGHSFVSPMATNTTD